MPKFLGRNEELQRLNEAIQKKSASFIVIKGRRRIGKSRLVQEFSKSFEHFYSFTALPPDTTTTRQHQLNEFCRQLAQNFKTPVAQYNDWGDAFLALAERVKHGKILLFFDEISWMGGLDPSFLGKIKNLWDLNLKSNPKLVFIICGSASAWIEKNIMSGAGFVGRISFTITLRELPMSDCFLFWPKNISIYEKIKVLAVTGGVPKYLEEINPKISAEENIKKLCFTEGGLLVEEYRHIFSDIFLRESQFYDKITHILAEGAKELEEIQEKIGIKIIGRLSEYLWELELAGFITRDYTWNIKTGADSKLSKYRLSDNYLRFYLKYIEKNRDKMKRGSFNLKSFSSLPEWNQMMGLQFENLLLHNRAKIHKMLGLQAIDIICDNPYFQRKTQRYSGCQIDYLIETKFNTLYICEFKFSKNLIGNSVIEEIQKKINCLPNHNKFSCRPVLIHVNGVQKELLESDFFTAVIGIEELFA
ncbi:MAG: ATP-binding protein [Bdellovibrionota bacterium]